MNKNTLSTIFPHLLAWWRRELEKEYLTNSSAKAKRAYRERQQAKEGAWIAANRQALNWIFIIQCWSRAGALLEKRRKEGIKWTLANPDRRRQFAREWVRKHRQACTDNMWRWRKENKEKSRATRLAWYKKARVTNLVWKLGVALRNRVRDAVGRGKPRAGTLTDLLGCSVAQLKAHLEALFRPGMTWDNYGEWHIDHIRPCASFDLTDPEQQKACFNFANLQPLWAKENLSKGAKLDAA